MALEYGTGVCFIDPTIVDGLKGLLSLRNFLMQIQVLSSHQLDTIGDDLCAAQEAVHPPFAERSREWLRNAKADGDQDVQTLYIALALDELKTYALRPNTNSLYQVRSSWWNSA